MESFTCLLCRREFRKTDEVENVCKACDDQPRRTLTYRSDPHRRDDVDGYDGVWSNAVKANENF